MSEYIDASIIVKWYKKDEAGYEDAKNIKQRIVDFKSDFVMSEFDCKITRDMSPC